MLKSQSTQLKMSTAREKINNLLAMESLTDEQTTELDGLTKEMRSLEVEFRAALTVEADTEQRALESTPDAEMRERIELRSKASLTGYLQAALAGRQVAGAEAELQAAAGIGNGIPLELWDTPVETRADASTGAPGTVGVNLDPIRPAVFANSIAPRLGIEMPRVASGTYASATITTSLMADSKAKGAAQESTAAAFTVSSVTPKRISARLGIRIEDVASVGQANFESILRENLSLVLSDELDNQVINGVYVDGTNNDLNGIFKALTDPTEPTAVAGFDDFVAAFAGGVDGLWSSTLKDVAVVCGPSTYQLSAKTFRDVGTNNGHRDDIAFSDYAMAHAGG